MTYYIEYETDILLNIDYKDIINKVIEEALLYESCPYEVEVNCILTGNKEIQEINLLHRQIDSATDVISFPMINYTMPSDFSTIEEDDITCFNPDSGELMLGDIVISVEKVIEQAESYGHSLERELAFLIAHSMLHLFGYDHIAEEERIIMEKKQTDILDKLGITR